MGGGIKVEGNSIRKIGKNIYMRKQKWAGMKMKSNKNRSREGRKRGRGSTRVMHDLNKNKIIL